MYYTYMYYIIYYIYMHYTCVIEAESKRVWDIRCNRMNLLNFDGLLWTVECIVRMMRMNCDHFMVNKLVCSTRRYNNLRSDKISRSYLSFTIYFNVHDFLDYLFPSSPFPCFVTVIT